LGLISTKLPRRRRCSKARIQRNEAGFGFIFPKRVAEDFSVFLGGLGVLAVISSGRSWQLISGGNGF
jgi:hypothetical protein